MTGEPAMTSDGGGDRLLPEDDYLLQREKAAAGTVLTAYNGGDPLSDPPAFGYPENMQVEIERRLILDQDRNKKMNEAVFLNPDSGWGQVKSFMDGMFNRYKEQNAAQLIKKPTNEEEWLQQAQQSRPVTVDPNEVANIRQLATKLDQQMRAVDPRTSFWTDPRTKGYAEWLNREAGVGTAGFMQSGEQPVEMGVAGRAAYTAWQAIEGIAAGPMSLIHGSWDIARKSIQAMGGPDIGASYPTNYITNEDGEMVSNGGKVPSIMDGIVMAWNYATDQNIEKAAADLGRAEQWEQANRAGLSGITTSVSRLGGELLGMAPGFGVAMKAGESLALKGLQSLGTLRLAKGVESSERALKIISAMAKGTGQAAGMAAYESVTNGRVEGYAASYMHGLAMAPVLMTLGALGKQAEWFAKNRAGMPAVAARAVAGGLEGMGFGAVETLAPELLPSAWGFIRDPNQETWETYAKNMLAFGLVKMVAGRTLGASPEEVARASGAARLGEAERVARGEAPATREGMQELGEASMQAREGRTPQERQEAEERKRAIEERLNVEEFGRGPAEEEVHKVTSAKDVAESIRAEREAREQPAKLSAEEGAVRFGRALSEGRSGPYQTQRRGPLGRLAQEEIAKQYRESTARLELHKPEGLEGPPEPKFERPPTPEEQFVKGIEPEFEKAAEKGPPPPKPLTPEQELLRGEADVPRGTSEPEVLEARGYTGERLGPQSLQLPPTRQIEAEPGVQQVKAADIFTEMEGRPGPKGFRIPFTATRLGAEPGDAVQVPMRGGKITRKGTLGLFRIFDNVVRTREGRDLVVAAHEWSHAMHRHMISAKGGKDFTKAAKDQLLDALAKDANISKDIATILKDYPGADQLPKSHIWMEAWAEWNARNLLGEVGLDQKLPAISAWMRSWLAAPEQARLRDQYQRIQAMLYRYSAQGSLGRLRQSRVSGAAPPTETEKAVRPSPIRRAMTALNKAWFDDMAELKQRQEHWMKAVGRDPSEVSIMDDPSRQYDALRMTAAKTVEHFVTHGAKRPDGTKIPGLKAVMDSVRGRTEEFTDYVVAVRSLELYKRGKEVQLPPQDYVESLKRIDANNPDFVVALRELKQWTDALIDFVQGAGNISVEDAQRLKDAYAVYVPFFRAIEGPAQHGQGRGVAEKGTGLSRIKGSTYEIKDPFIALQQVARSMVAKAHQNQVMAALYKMAAGQEAGGLATIVPRSSIPKDHPLSELLDAIEAKVGVPPTMSGGQIEDFFGALRDADALNPQTITTFSQKVIPTGERNIIAFTPRLTEAEIDQLVAKGAARSSLVKANERLQWLEVDTKVYEALMGIDKLPQLPESLQPMMKIAQAPRDLIRFFATGVQPAFVAANMIRDALSAPLFNRNGEFRPFGGFVKMIRGAVEYHRNGEMRDLYEELGVKTSSFWTEGRQRSLIGERTSLWQKAKAMADRVQEWFSHPENYIRMAEFKDTYEKAKAEGKGEQEARILALEAGREITVNFARAGIWARALNQLVPYFNAGLQGQRKLWSQLLRGGEGSLSDEMRARVQRATILNGIANITVPATLFWLLNKDEEWYQDLPEWRKINYFNFKLGDQIVAVPKPFEIGVLFGSLPEIMLDRVLGSGSAELKSAMLAVGGPYLQGVGSFIPAFLKPIFEVATNKDLFTMGPVTPEWIQRSSPSEQWATFRTTKAAQILSSAIGGILAPTEIEQLLGGYTAGAATSAMKMLDEIAGLKDHPGIALNPMARFFKQTEHGQSHYVDQLYKLSMELDQQEETLDAQRQGLRRRVNTAKRQISDLRKSYREGRITQQEAERRSYEIARPLVESGNR